MAVTCPACSELLTSSEAEEGWCPCCQARLPRSTKDDAPATLREERHSDPSDRSIWTTPVIPENWPAVRWLMQSIAGLILVLFLAPSVTVIPFFSKSTPERVFHVLLFGLPLGLCLAATLNGVIVARSTRRLTLLSVAAVELAVIVYGSAIFGMATLLRQG
jgi:hypothetical protein